MHSHSDDHLPRASRRSVFCVQRICEPWIRVFPVIFILLAAGCQTKSTSTVQPVGTSKIEGNLASDTQQDLGHEHRHLHGGGQRHDHEHDGFEGAHEHPHLHGHRHAPPSHGGEVVAIGHTDHKSPFQKHYHAEVTPVVDGVLRIYLSCMESAGDTPPTGETRFAPDSFSGTLHSSTANSATQTNTDAIQLVFERDGESADNCFPFLAELPTTWTPSTEEDTLWLSVPQINLGGEAYAFEAKISISLY